MPFYPGILAASNASFVPSVWVYPLQTAFVDHGQILTGSGWDAVSWNVHGQCLVPVGPTMHLYYEGGDVWATEHAEHSKLGVLTSTDGSNWIDYSGNPIAEFNPLANGGINPNEEGYWYHGVWRRPNGEFTCVFGGQSGVSASGVRINVYMQTSSDGLAWTPNSHVGAITIIDENDTTFAGYGTTNDELGGTGVWYDEANSLWHVIYTSKNLAGEVYSAYHAQGADLEALAGADSNLLLHIDNNPYVAGAATRGGAIVDRGNGFVDVVSLCLDANADITLQTGAIVRIPILPDYSWTSPGPPEILYYMSEDFGINAAVRPTVGFFPAVAKALIPYIQYSDQDVRMKSAPAVQSADGRLPYAPASARFTSSSDQYLSRAGLTGQASSKLVTFCFAVKPITIGGTSQAVFRMENSGGAYRFEILLSGALSGITVLGRNSAGTVILNMASSVALTTGVWHTVVGSIDMASYTNTQVYLDRVAVKPGSATTFTNDTLAFADTALTLFGHESAANLPVNAEITDFGLLIGKWFDLTDSRILDRFFTPDNELQNPRVDGRGLFGQKPIVFFSGNATNFPTNRGTGGAFTLSNGPLTNGSSPAGHP